MGGITKNLQQNLLTNYLNGGDNVESPAYRPRTRPRKNSTLLLPKSVFIESSINGSCEEIQFCTSSVEQVPEFERCRYKKGEVIVNLQSVFHGVFPNVKIKTISKRVVDVHQRKIKLWEARVCISAGEIKQMSWPASP